MIKQAVVTENTPCVASGKRGNTVDKNGESFATDQLIKEASTDYSLRSLKTDKKEVVEDVS